MIDVPCPCGETYHTDHSRIGRTIRCWKCGRVLSVDRPKPGAGRSIQAGGRKVFLRGLFGRQMKGSDTDARNFDEKWIRDEVEKRKKRATDLGIIRVAWELYQDLSCYGTSTRGCPEPVRGAIDVMRKTHSGGHTRIECTIGGNPYVFTFREWTVDYPDDEGHVGYLDLEYWGDLVMTIECSYSDGGVWVGGYWAPGTVSAFKEGPWVQELNWVHTESSKTRQEQHRAEREAEIRRLKKDFGL